LMRLFPRTEAVWSNMHYSETREWSKERKVCSPEHFDTYFRYSLSTHTVPISEINELIARADDRDFVVSCLTDALDEQQAEGRTKASFMLDEVCNHAERFDDGKIAPFVTTLFAIADRLFVESDQEQSFSSIADNRFRIHWIIRALTYERLSPEERSSIFSDACQIASLAWLEDFACSAHAEYHPQEGREPKPPEKCLMTAEDAEAITKLARQRIAEAAEAGTLLQKPNLAGLLFRWCDFSSDEGAAVRDWTDQQLDTDEGLVAMAKAFLGESRSHGVGFHGMGDLVSRVNDRAQVEGIETIMSPEKFRARLSEYLSKDDADPDACDVVQRLLTAWEVREAGRD